jgi:hypothetical protein
MEEEVLRALRTGIGETLRQKAMIFTATILNPPNTGKELLKRALQELDQKDKKKAWLNKYVVISTKTNPIVLVCGQVIDIEWYGKKEFLIIYNEEHGYKSRLDLDNAEIPYIFDDKEKYETYLKEQLERDNLRKGSYILTLKGSIEYGILVLKVLKLIMNDKNDINTSIFFESIPDFFDYITKFQESLISLRDNHNNHRITDYILENIGLMRFLNLDFPHQNLGYVVVISIISNLLDTILFAAMVKKLNIAYNRVQQEEKHDK